MYKSAIRSKKKIQEAVIRLIANDKDFASISITDIAKEANINRGTFYNHYDNLNDVIEEMEDDLMEEMMATWEEGRKRDNSIEYFLNATKEKLKEHEDTYRKLIKAIPSHVFDNVRFRFLNEVESKYHDCLYLDANTKITLCLISDGIVGLFLDYFEGRVPCSLDQITESSIKLIKKVFTREAKH